MVSSVDEEGGMERGRERKGDSVNVKMRECEGQERVETCWDRVLSDMS